MVDELDDPFFSSTQGIADWLSEHVLAFQDAFTAHPDQAYHALAICRPPPPEPDDIIRSLGAEDQVAEHVDATFKKAWATWSMAIREWVQDDFHNFFEIYDKRCVSDLISTCTSEPRRHSHAAFSRRRIWYKRKLYSSLHVQALKSKKGAPRRTINVRPNLNAPDRPDETSKVSSKVQ